jgi:hypothetical protein
MAMAAHGPIVSTLRGLIALVAVCVICDSAKASFGCKEADGLVVCDPAFVSASAGDRVSESRKLLDGEDCKSPEISAKGWMASESIFRPSSVTVLIKSECRYTVTLPAQRISEEGTTRYEFDCFRHLLKYYASGFDFFGDRKRSHWDSQGTARPLPWRPVEVASGDNQLLVGAWCH